MAVEEDGLESECRIEALVSNTFQCQSLSRWVAMEKRFNLCHIYNFGIILTRVVCRVSN